MDFIVNLLNSNIFSSIVGLFGVAFGVWQYKRATNLQKIVNDRVRTIYQDSKKIIEFSKKQNNYQTIAERARAVKQSIVGLDIINRNLNKRKIDKLQKDSKLTQEEASEYKNLSSD